MENSLFHAVIARKDLPAAQLFTELEQLKPGGFYEAELYHQNYAACNATNPYVRSQAIPKVRKVREKSLFAKAGFANEDQVTAIDKTKIASREQFRRAVRRLSAQKKNAVFKVKRGDRILELIIDFSG